jgi:hypothetical protein
VPGARNQLAKASLPHLLVPGSWRLAPTACRHPVSGTVSLPSSGCFSPFPHGTGALSVTEEYLGLEGGPPVFGQDFPCPALLMDRTPAFPYGAVTRSGPPFQALPVAKSAATGLVRVRSPLLTESRLMSFPPASEMFQFAGFASPSYGFRWRYPLARVGCPIRRSADRRALAPPRSFSQRATSFFASQCQGIHQMPFCCAHHAPTAAPSGKPPEAAQPVKTLLSLPGASPRARGQAPGVTSRLSSLLSNSILAAPWWR